MFNTINNKKIIQNSFMGVINKKEKMSDDEKFKLLTRRAVSKMQERGEMEMPAYGHFRSIRHIFDIPNTQNEAVFTIKHPLTGPKNERILTIGVKKQANDEEMYNVVASGTKEQIQKALDELDLDETSAKIKILSKKVDDMYR